MIELHNGNLFYYPKKVIYMGKEFDAPVDAVVLMGYEIFYNELKERERIRRVM